jgi:hypothetical protein
MKPRILIISEGVVRFDRYFFIYVGMIGRMVGHHTDWVSKFPLCWTNNAKPTNCTWYGEPTACSITGAGLVLVACVSFTWLRACYETLHLHRILKSQFLFRNTTLGKSTTHVFCPYDDKWTPLAPRPSSLPPCPASGSPSSLSMAADRCASKLLHSYTAPRTTMSVRILPPLGEHRDHGCPNLLACHGPCAAGAPPLLGERAKQSSWNSRAWGWWHNPRDGAVNQARCQEPNCSSSWFYLRYRIWDSNYNEQEEGDSEIRAEVGEKKAADAFLLIQLGCSESGLPQGICSVRAGSAPGPCCSPRSQPGYGYG